MKSALTCISKFANIADMKKRRRATVSPLGQSVEEWHRTQLRDPAYRRASEKYAVAEQCARLLLIHRALLGLTQKQLAKRLRMTESMISRLERGDHIPSVETVCRVAKALGKRVVVRFEPLVRRGIANTA